MGGVLFSSKMVEMIKMCIYEEVKDTWKESYHS